MTRNTFEAKGNPMRPMTAAELNVALKKAKTLEESHALAVLLVQTLKAKYDRIK